MPTNRNVKVLTYEAELEFAIQSVTTGKQLFDQVVRTLGLREVWYFGLQFTDNKGFLNWLQLDKKVLSQDVPKGDVLQFKLSVKFFPEDVGEDLIQEVTVRMFYLHVKDGIVNGAIFCPPETAVLLASYGCQAKYGDFNADVHHPGSIGADRLLPQRVREQHTMDGKEWDERIIEWWSQIKGKTREEIMLDYLKVAQDFEMYGVNFFDIKNKKGTELLVGIDSLGINVYKRDDRITPQIGFPWSDIRNISYSDRKFIIKPVDKNSPNFIFYTANVRVNKRILSLAMGNHELYIRRRKPDTIEVQQMRAQSEEERKQKQAERERLDLERRSKQEALKEQEELSRRLRELEEERLKREEEQREMSERLQSMMAQIEEEREHKAALQAAYEEEKELMRRMAEEKDQTSAEYQALQDQFNQVKTEINEKESELENVRTERESAALELESAKNEKEELLQKAKEYEDQLAQQQAHNQELEIGRELESVQNGAQSELERQTLMEENQALQSKLAMLAEELRTTRNTEKVDQMSVIHDENVRKGMDKFKTLRQIRQGNTKKRVYEFESM